MAKRFTGNPIFYIDYLSYWKAIGNVVGCGNTTNVNPQNPDYSADKEQIMQGKSHYNPDLIGLNVYASTFEEFNMGDNEASDNVDLDLYVVPGVGASTRFSVILDKGFDLAYGDTSNDNDARFFYGVLGHNLYSTGVSLRSFVRRQGDTDYYEAFSGGSTNQYGVQGPCDEVCNFPEDHTASPLYNGWSIATFGSSSNYDWDSFDFLMSTVEEAGGGYATSKEISIGSLVFGQTYEMPHSPDLNVEMGYTYEGIKSFNSTGGHTMNSFDYIGPPHWPNGLNPWELSTAFEYGGKITPPRTLGRRFWNLSFSYISSDDMLPYNSLWSRPTPTRDYTGGEDSPVESAAGWNGPIQSDEIEQPAGYEPRFKDTIMASYSFIGTVIDKTLGGKLPFIFQPNKDNYLPDSFALCTLDMDSISITQVSQSVYSMQITVREVW